LRLIRGLDGDTTPVEAIRVWQVLKIAKSHTIGAEALKPTEDALEALVERHLLKREGDGYVFTDMGAFITYWEDIRRKGASPATMEQMGWKGTPIQGHPLNWHRPTDEEYHRAFLVVDDETAWNWWQKQGGS